MSDVTRPSAVGLEAALERAVFVDPSVRERLALHVRGRGEPGRGRVILCLLGAPGMGKAAIVRALGDALSLAVVRIPIGEIRGEEETILGSRRADLNATAGRIIHGLGGLPAREAIVLLENIDRTDVSGTRHASVGFFEVLDYVHTVAVNERHLPGPLDFSKVVFMATARNLASIPPGLREQMEFVVLPSYTEFQKLRIARNFLLPEAARLHGIDGTVGISDAALRTVIRRYTREGGVGELRAQLSSVIRQAAPRHAGARVAALKISTTQIPGFLGPERFPSHRAGGNRVGAVTLLGMSDKGGCPVTLELIAPPGGGKVLVTGNADKLFHESALVAVGYVQSHHRALGVEADFMRNRDIHVHLLEGTTPKHGVSAGLAIVTALVSALTGKPVRGDAGLTGEIGLHGQVLPVGDIRDKILGAFQAELRAVLLPRGNTGDLAAIPREVRRALEFVVVDDVAQALKHAVGGVTST
jgi:ATP-dependent Lon protease